ncbi:unnamed protein product [Leuciscus chuanchicus]
MREKSKAQTKDKCKNPGPGMARAPHTNPKPLEQQEWAEQKPPLLLLRRRGRCLENWRAFEWRINEFLKRTPDKPGTRTTDLCRPVH